MWLCILCGRPRGGSSSAAQQADPPVVAQGADAVAGGLGVVGVLCQGSSIVQREQASLGGHGVIRQIMLRPDVKVKAHVRHIAAM